MTHEEIIASLIEKHRPEIRKAFMLSIEQIKDDVIITELVNHLEAGDLQAAIRSLGFEPHQFRAFESALATAFEEGGNAIVDTFPILNTPIGRTVFRFNVRNIEAEKYLRDHSSNLITRISSEQKKTARVFLSQNMAAGANPRSTALDLVGRVSRTARHRTGGVLGLSAPQERYVAKARQQLLSGDPSEIRDYLTRTRRDKRFDAKIIKAMEDGKPVDMATVQRASGRYSDRLLKTRGDNIARTESISTLNRSQFESYRQAYETGGVKDITRIWDTTGRDNVRHTHRGMDEQKRTKLDPFRSPSGAILMHPGDTTNGAPAAETINCACRIRSNIDFLARIK